MPFADLRIGLPAKGTARRVERAAWSLELLRCGIRDGLDLAGPADQDHTYGRAFARGCRIGRRIGARRA